MQKFFAMVALVISASKSPSAFAQNASLTHRIGVDTFVYLRCTSTSWELDGSSRLTPSTSGSFLRELTFEVKESWMTETGDDCVLTETSEKDAGGLWQRDYTGQLTLLRVPQSTHLRKTEPGENSKFRLVFPSLGKYRFTLNTRDGYFSVRKDADPKPGEVEWTLPSNLLNDSRGRLFASNSYPRHSISLIDTDSGLPTWTYVAESYVSFYANCVREDSIIVSLSGRVVSLSVKTGEELWTNDLGGVLKDSYGFLNCHPDSDDVYLSYGSDKTKLVSLNPTNGQELWTWTAPGFAGFKGVDSQRVFVESYVDAKASLKALQKISGRELWEADPGQGFHSLSPDGSMYWVNGSELTALDSATGQGLWTFSGKQNDSIWLSFENEGLYVREKSRISLLDRERGHLLWSHSYGAFADQYPQTLVLKSGVVLIRIEDYQGRQGRQIALNCSTGKVMWERDDLAGPGYVSEGNMSGTWIISGKSIQHLDPRTGAIGWTYNLDSDHAYENIMTVLEQDLTTVYVAYGSQANKYPSMGVLAFDVITGQLKWKSWVGSPIYRVGSDDRTLILNTNYPESVKALRK